MINIEITPELLEGLRGKARAAEKVSSSPWKSVCDFKDYPEEPANNIVECSRGGYICEGCSPEESDHIAAANPAVVLALVAEIERLQKALMAIHELERKRWESAVKAFRTIPGELLMEN